MTHFTSGSRTERGSATVEAAILAAAALLLVLGIVAGGRFATTHQALESAASDAARVASLARSPVLAQTEARGAALQSIANQHIRCRDTSVQVNTRDLLKPAGRPGEVTVTVSCRLDLSDLSLPGIPGSHVLTSTMRSPIDTWRQAP